LGLCFFKHEVERRNLVAVWTDGSPFMTDNVPFTLENVFKSQIYCNIILLLINGTYHLG
jgi:hypothetical protein